VSRAIVRIADHPDLLPVVAAWLHEAFGRAHGGTIGSARRYVADFLAPGATEQCFVALDGAVPVGTASLVAHDLDTRPELTPWLASVFVLPEFRRLGHASRLVRRVEAAAQADGARRLHLFTVSATPLYAGLGWTVMAPGMDRGQPVTIMCRDLA
jgi:GNAT superfamily N-acetyltransferase